MKLSELKTPPVEEAEGEWLPYRAGVKLKIRRIGNKDYDRFMQSKARPIVMRSAKRRTKSGELQPIIMEAMSRFVLVDWEGVTTEEGVAVPYTWETGLNTMRSNYKFFKDVQELGGVQGDLEEEFMDDIEGNSEKPLDGKDNSADSDES